MRVHCHDDRGEVGEFEPGDGSLRRYRRSSVPNRYTPARGHYATLDHRLAVLYRDSGGLKFWLEGAGVIALIEDASFSWQMVTKNKARLTIETGEPGGSEPGGREPDGGEPGGGESGKTELIEVTYRSNYAKITSLIAATPDSSREDWDFGLYVSNLAKDAQRREQLYRDDR